MAESSFGSITPAVSRDGFTYSNGQFYAQVDGHLHKREDPATLYVLLTLVAPPPVPDKDGKIPKRSTSADREVHFYRAQLLHYGLPPLKTRDPAKKKLLAAYGGANGKTLEPPKEILDLEAALRKEWHEMDAKAAKSMKRKASAVEVNEVKTAVPVKRLKQTARKSTGGSLMGKQVAYQQSNDINAVAGSSNTGLGLKDDKAADPPKRTKQTARKSKVKAHIRQQIATLPEDKLRKLLIVLLRDIPEVEDALLTEILAISSKDPAAKKVKNKEESKGELAALDPSNWTGIYSIRAPKLAEEWDSVRSYDMTLEMYPSSTSTHVWASFDFGMVSGVMRSPLPPPTSFNTERLFEWRGHVGGMDSESVMSFGDSNTAAITFMGEGKIKGKMSGSGLQPLTFSGQYQARGPPRKLGSRQHEEVKSWKREWRSINDSNYEAENESRWGNRYSRGGRDDSPFDSDTTADHSDWEEED